MEGNKRVTVTIQGDQYIVKGNNSQEYVNKIAEYVDNIMEELSKSNTLMNKTMVAVLCALNLTDQLCKVKENVVQLEDKLVEVENTPELKKELENAKDNAEFHLEKCKELQRRLTEVNMDLDRYQEKLETYKSKIKQNRIELDAAKQTISDLQNQIFDNQIDIAKMRKELDGYRMKENVNKKSYSKHRNKK